MNIQLTQKERLLLEDQKSHEEMCIKKYTDYADQVEDPRLKQMFQKIAGQEQQHLNTVNQILNGQVPSMQGQQGQSGGQGGMQSQQGQGNMQGSQVMQGSISSMQGSQNMQGSEGGSQTSQNMQNVQQVQNLTTAGSYNAQDKDICTDLLTMEKYISGTYDITIFECVDANVRQALNHIQKEEQQHGEEIFSYMQSTGMYIPQ